MEGARRRGLFGIPGTVIYPIAFFFLFMGGGAFQQFYMAGVARTTGITLAQASLLLATVYFAFAASRLLVGRLAYRLGEYGCLILGALTYVGFPAALLVTDHFAGLAISCALMGAGAATIHTVTPSLMLDAGDKGNRRGRSVGSLYSWLCVGFALGVAVYAILEPGGDVRDARQGYRVMAAVSALVTLVGVAAIAAGPRNIPKRDFPTFARFVEIMKIRGAWLLAVILIGSSISFALMLSVFFTEISENVTLKVAGLAGFHVLRMLSSYASGRLSDRVRRSRIMTACFFAAGVAILVAGWVDAGWMWVVASVVLGAQAGTAVVSPQAIVGDWAGRGKRHIALGGIFLWGNLGVGLTIFGSTWLHQALGSSSWTWTLFGLILVTLALLSMMLERFSTQTNGET